MRTRALVIAAALLALGRVIAWCAPSETAPVLDPAPTSEYPAWYTFDAMQAPDAPRFHVWDTESALGRYAGMTKLIALKDLVKMHGHPCDGLVTAACALKLGLQELYQDGVIDRTDTCVITNNSACFVDVAAYVTGARIRFGTQKIDPELGDEFIVYRQSTKKAVKVALRPGVFPPTLKTLEDKIRGDRGAATDIDLCREAGTAFAHWLLQQPTESTFVLTALEGFVWEPDEYEHVGQRTDILAKSAPRPDSSPVRPDAKLPTVVDFGATGCIPCKMMAPILERLKRDLAGRVHIVFVDVYEEAELVAKHGIRTIPTQVFLDADGKELTRHEGFMSAMDIMLTLRRQGIDPYGVDTVLTHN